MRLRRIPAWMAAVSLLGCVVAGPAVADNTQPKREVLTSGGEGGAYSKLGGEDPTGGSDPTPTNPGPAAERALSGDPVSVPGDTYVIHETAPSAIAPRIGSLGGPITAQPNCYPNKIRYGYGNPGPGDDIAGATIVNTGPEVVLFPLLDRYGPQIEAELMEIAENPRNQALVAGALNRIGATIAQVAGEHPQAYGAFVRELYTLAFESSWHTPDVKSFFAAVGQVMEIAFQWMRLHHIGYGPTAGEVVLHSC